MMKPRIKVLTLVVEDLNRALTFYRDGLGLRTEGIIGQEFENGAVVFFSLTNDLMLALYPAASLSKDAKIDATKARLGAVSIGHIVKSKGEVDTLVRHARKAGAVITDPPKDRFWGGYSGYFHDPDGHLWEVAWNPAWSVAD
jgi:uncharacterized protein